MSTQSKVLVGIGIVVVLALLLLRKGAKPKPPPGPQPAEEGIPIDADLSAANAAVNAAELADDKGQISLEATDPDAIGDHLEREHGDDVIDAIPEPVEEVMWSGVSIHHAAAGVLSVPLSPLGAGTIQAAQESVEPEIE